MPNPRINPVVLLSPVEEGYVAYDPALDQLHHLNPAAALLMELCDGSRSVDDIRAMVGSLMPAGKVAEIDRWIDEATNAGLLLADGRDAAQRRELTSVELHTLAKRLREMGKVQTAFLCGKRAVELKPDDWSAWYDLGETALCVGRRDEARAAYQRYFGAHPEDAEIEHLLTALRDDTPPPRTSDRAIQHIYKTFAASYESRMLEDLKYVGPERIEDLVRFALGDQDGLSILDLGCGSGLAGVIMKRRAAELVGVDLSAEMIELAQARKIYDRLEVAEITGWLEQGREVFDLIVSSDCLIYFGDLNRIVNAAAKRVKKGGLFAFSLERGARYPFHLTDTGRYTHSADHVRDVATNAGLDVMRLDESFLRMEYGVEVTGLFVLLRQEGRSLRLSSHAAPVCSNCA
jgi:predicted TPR repeat methyltransferase